MNWYIVDEEYINYLLQFDPRVGFINYGDKLKLHVGTVLTSKNLKTAKLDTSMPY